MDCKNEIIKKNQNLGPILIIFTHGNAFNPRAGNETRVHNLISPLVKKGNTIITLESAEYKGIGKEIENTYRNFFNPIIIKKNHLGSFFADFNPSLIYKLYQVIKKYRPSVIQVEYPRGIIVAKMLSKIISPKTVVIYDAHDVEISRHLRVTMREKNLLFFKRAAIFLYDAIMEKLSCCVADHILTVSNQDRQEFIMLYNLPEEKITLIPIGTQIKKIKNFDNLSSHHEFGLDNNKKIVLFHGVYSYFPNAEAIKLIEEFIAPSLFKTEPSILFVIAGRDSPVCEKNNIKYLGFIDDLDKLLSVCDIAIVPILQGGGTRVKILDYLGAGLPIITTKKGIEGIDAENGIHAIILDTVDTQFINTIPVVIRDSELLKAIGINGRNLAELEYDLERIGNRLNLLYLNLQYH